MTSSEELELLKQEIRLLQSQTAELRSNQEMLSADLNTVRQTQNYLLEQMAKLHYKETQPPAAPDLRSEVFNLSRTVKRMQRQWADANRLWAGSFEAGTSEAAASKPAAPKAAIAPARGDGTVVSELIALGIPSHIKGFRYIQEAIALIHRDRSMLTQVTQKLYPALAERYRTTPSRIERAIRHAIASTGASESMAALLGVPTIGKTRPSNSQFLSLLANATSPKAD